jgi:hypothetical protein
MTNHIMTMLTDERRDSLIDWAKGYLNAAEIYVASNPR